MRKTGYPFVQKITKANIKANSNFESVENANFEYVYMLGSESWFEDYFYIPIKCINSSLKFAEKEIEEGTLNTELTQ